MGNSFYATTSSHETCSLKIRTWWGYSYAVELDLNGSTPVGVDRPSD